MGDPNTPNTHAEEAHPMTIDDLQTALESLPTERLERLVDRLERDPEINVTVGAWLPHCPMVLAGFDPGHADSNLPEHRFAAVWDRVATPKTRSWLALPATGRPARRSDVQLLLRRANAVLAYRATRYRSDDRRRRTVRRVARSGGTGS
jgi:hypothetical protein